MSNPLHNVKILFLLVNDVTHDQRIHRITHTLKEAGADVTVFGRERPWSTKVDWDTISVRRFEVEPDGGPMMYLNMNRIYARQGLKEAWDIVVSNDFDTLWAGKQISNKWKAKWVFDAHEYFTEVPELEGRNFKKFIWHLLGKWCIPKTDLALSVSQSLSEELGKVYKHNFHTIPNVPYPSYPSNQEVQESIILYQGALNKGRGLETAIKAMHQIEDAKLVLAGEGDLSNELRQMVKREQLEEKVEFRGWVKPGDLKMLTRSAWVGLNLLAANSKNYYYSLANKFFDYAQAGIPSINMDFPEYKRLINQYHSGVLLSTLELSEYTEFITTLQKDKDRYQTLCKGASKLAEDYNWEVYAPRLIHLYESLYE